MLARTEVIVVAVVAATAVAPVSSAERRGVLPSRGHAGHGGRYRGGTIEPLASRIGRQPRSPPRSTGVAVRC